MDALKIIYPKAYEKLSWEKHLDTSHPSYKKTDKTLEEALKEGDFNVISEGDEGFKEISEKFIRQYIGMEKGIKLDLKMLDNNISELYNTFLKAKSHKSPVAIVANTTKGKGFSFSENNNAWHHAPLSSSQYEAALKELKT